MAVQSHGFTWEKDILRSVYGATETELESIGYTAAKDFPGSFNKLDPGVDLSIKTTKAPGVVRMADALRVFESCGSGQTFHLVVVTYRQSSPTTKTLTSIIEVDLTNSRETLFGSVTSEDIRELKKLIEAVPKSRRKTAEESKAIKEFNFKIKNKTGAIILNPKIDSKSQRRLQCSFNKFLEFLAENPDRIVARSLDGAFRTGQIQETIVSSPRVLKEKRP